MKKVLLPLLWAIASVAWSQGTQLIQVNTHEQGAISGCITDAGGTPANGTVIIQATDGTGHSLPFRSIINNSNTQVLGNSVQRPVIDGQISNIQLQLYTGVNNQKIPYTFTYNIGGHSTTYQNVDISPQGLNQFNWCAANLTGNIVSGPITIKGDPGTVTATGVNGDFLVPGTFSSTNAIINSLVTKISDGRYNASKFNSDIALGVNAVAALCSGRCTAFVPSGQYYTSTTIKLIPSNPANYMKNGYLKLELDSGAVINYSGSGDAVDGPIAWQGNNGYYDIGGGQINCQNANASGIVLWPSNHGYVHDTIVSGCLNGLWIRGANQGEIARNHFTGNATGMLFDGALCQGDGVTCGSGPIGFAPNAWFVHGNEVGAGNNGIVIAINWYALDNTFIGNTIEGNTGWGFWDQQSEGTVLESNYFEANTKGHVLFGGLGPGYPYNPKIINNYFTVGTTNTSTIRIAGANTPIITGNSESSATGGWPKCFTDITITQGPPIMYGNMTIPVLGVPGATEATLCGVVNGADYTPVTGDYFGQTYIPIGVRYDGSVDVNGHIATNSFGSFGTVTTPSNNGGAGSFFFGPDGAFPASETLYGRIGPLRVYLAANDPGGVCGAVDIEFTPHGMSYCQNGVWTKK